MAVLNILTYALNLSRISCFGFPGRCSPQSRLVILEIRGSGSLGVWPITRITLPAALQSLRPVQVARFVVLYFPQAIESAIFSQFAPISQCSGVVFLHHAVMQSVSGGAAVPEVHLVRCGSPGPGIAAQSVWLRNAGRITSPLTLALMGRGLGPWKREQRRYL